MHVEVAICDQYGRRWLRDRLLTVPGVVWFSVGVAEREWRQGLFSESANWIMQVERATRVQHVFDVILLEKRGHKEETRLLHRFA